MEHQPARKEQIREAMESCRPGSDDLLDGALAPLAAVLAQDAELQTRFGRLQRTDAAVAAAFRDVPIPDGLANRLLDRLAAAQAEAAASPAQPGAQPGDWPNFRPTKMGLSPSPAEGQGRGGDPGRRRFSRRWLLLAAASLSAAAALLAAAWLGIHPQTRVTPLAVLDEATDFFQGESPAAAHRLDEVSPPADYPLSREVLATAQIRWRPIQGLLGRGGVAYDLSGPGRVRATLYVTRQVVAGLPTQPPGGPRPTTAGCCAAAWQENGLLYVLVLEGEPRAYRGYLTPSGPLT
jgi:hypothetical protein